MFFRDTKRRLELFKNHSYSYFVISGILATFGNGLIYITMSWEAYQIHSSISSLTVLMVCVWMPSILFGPFFGACADTFNRKQLLIISNLVRGICIIVFAVCHILSFHPNIYFLATILGIFVSFYMPAALPLMQEIIDKDQLINANTTVDLLYELGTGIGMGVSGYLIIYLGSYVTMLIGGVLFVCASIFNMLMKYKKHAIEKSLSISIRQIAIDYFFIIRYLNLHRKLLPIYLTQALLLVMLMTLPILLLPFVQQVLNAGSKEFALFEVVFSIGMICGGIYSPTLSNKLGLKFAIGILMLILSICLFLFAINIEKITTFIVYFFVGFGLSAWALILSYSQMFTDNKVQGRLQASFFSLTGVVVLLFYVFLDFYSAKTPVNLIYIAQSIIAACGIVFVSLIKLKEVLIR